MPSSAIGKNAFDADFIFTTTIEGVKFGFVGALVIDQLFVRHVLREKARFFFLHVIFNAWVTSVVYKDAFDSLANPTDALTPRYAFSPIVTTAGIAGFHTYHMLFYKNLTTEDLVHHIVSCLIVPAIGILCPYGKVVTIVNLGMCGVPGGIDYFLLTLVKYEVMDKLTEKRINRWLNLVLRWPLMLLSVYLIMVGFGQGKFSDLSGYVQFLIVLGGALHSLNAVYYCDKVVGNYHVSSFAGGKRKGEKRARETLAKILPADSNQGRTSPEVTKSGKKRS